jgi:hypothetical protein
VGLPMDPLGGPVDLDLLQKVFWPPSPSTCTPMLLLSPAMRRDVNGDSIFNTDDLLQLIAAWRWFNPDDHYGPDLNLDGNVGVDDLLELLAFWTTGGINCPVIERLADPTVGAVARAVTPAGFQLLDP